MNFKKVICYDFEMCCWEDRPSGEIIEFGLVEVDLIKRKVTRESQYFVIPDKDEISDFCVELTGHSRRVIYRQGRPLADVLRTVEEKYGVNKPYIAWGKDEEVLRKECAEKVIPVSIKEFINLSTVYNIMNPSHKRKGQIMAMEEQGLKFEGRAHSGLVDSRNLARLLLEIVK